MQRRRGITALDIVALTVATIGAINWGFTAANFNLVRRLFGRGTLLERATYALVGLAGLDLAWLTARFVSGAMQGPSGRGVMQQLGRQAQQMGRGVEQAGKEIQRGSFPSGGPYEQPSMRP